MLALLCVSHDFAHKVLPWQLPPLDLHGKVEYQWCTQMWDFCVPIFLLSNTGMDGLSGTEKQNHVEYL